jgi:hypothetical protein
LVRTVYLSMLVEKHQFVCDMVGSEVWNRNLHISCVLGAHHYILVLLILESRVVIYIRLGTALRLESSLALIVLGEILNKTHVRLS